MLSYAIWRRGATTYVSIHLCFRIRFYIYDASEYEVCHSVSTSIVKSTQKTYVIVLYSYILTKVVKFILYTRTR